MAGRSQGSAFTILVVEDDPDALRMYSAFLTAKGCSVFEASDGRGGIDKAIELRPDVVVLDLQMPRVDGWTVLASLRESSWTADIPIVVVTAMSDARDAALCAGADACLTKPCPPDVLWHQIRGLLRAGPSQRHRRAQLDRIL
jgi:DNA-binding response OmpR family regulator